MFLRFFSVAMVVLSVGFATVSFAATTQAQSQDGVLLTIDVRPGPDRPKTEVLLDMEALRDLPVTEFETTTIWTDGLQRFKGVRLTDLLECLEIKNGTVWLSALNEYLIDIPNDELRPDGAMIAYERNGAPMSTRDKGPLWVVFPYDHDPSFQTETTYARSVWQLDYIEITD